MNANTVSVIAMIVNAILVLVNTFQTTRAARYYGDVAGAKMVIEHAASEAKRARASALWSLVNEVGRVRKLVEHNCAARPPMVKLPTAAFESAFVSGAPGLAVGEEVVTAVTDYLCHADRVNAWVDVYVSGVTAAGGTPMARVQKALVGIGEICAKELPAVLVELTDALRREMGGG